MAHIHTWCIDTYYKFGNVKVQRAHKMLHTSQEKWNIQNKLSFFVALVDFMARSVPIFCWITNFSRDSSRNINSGRQFTLQKNENENQFSSLAKRAEVCCAVNNKNNNIFFNGYFPFDSEMKWINKFTYSVLHVHFIVGSTVIIISAIISTSSSV